ncbi:MAG: hypothetical protein QOF37_801 [Thermoleophilaceae bacterium]|jgi:hypothetical protein|nr:hypothetical protein [Thermoleophilaceae bacterium]
MGKRSRKRGDVEVSVTTRAERDAARARRAEALRRAEAGGRPRRPGRTSIDDRPPAPWGSFPLVELVVLLALILIVVGFVVRGPRGGTMIVGGFALGSLAGIELSIREHFGGFRSHTTLLAAATGFLAGAVTYLVSHDRVAPLPVAIVVFLAAFWAFRQAFMRKTGGATFRK